MDMNYVSGLVLFMEIFNFYFYDNKNNEYLKKS